MRAKAYFRPNLLAKAFGQSKLSKLASFFESRAALILLKLSKINRGISHARLLGEEGHGQHEQKLA
jgi:hypothetical protein